MSVKDPEALLLSVLGLTLLVAGVAAELKVSAAVGAFLVGIALSGPVAHHADRDAVAAAGPLRGGLLRLLRARPPTRPTCRRCCCPPSAWPCVTMATKVLTGYLAARRAGIAVPGRLRAGSR